VCVCVSSGELNEVMQLIGTARRCNVATGHVYRAAWLALGCVLCERERQREKVCVWVSVSVCVCVSGHVYRAARLALGCVLCV